MPIANSMHKHVSFIGWCHKYSSDRVFLIKTIIQIIRFSKPQMRFKTKKETSTCFNRAHPVRVSLDSMACYLVVRWITKVSCNYRCSWADSTPHGLMCMKNAPFFFCHINIIKWNSMLLNIQKSNIFTISVQFVSDRWAKKIINKTKTENIM